MNQRWQEPPDSGKQQGMTATSGDARPGTPRGPTVPLVLAVAIAAIAHRAVPLAPVARNLAGRGGKDAGYQALADSVDLSLFS